MEFFDTFQSNDTLSSKNSPRINLLTCAENYLYDVQYALSNWSVTLASVENIGAHFLKRYMSKYAKYDEAEFSKKNH